MEKQAGLFLKAVFIMSMTTSSHVQASDVAPLEWVATNIEEAISLDMHVDKQRFSFKGSQLTRYAVSLSRQLNQNWQLEAIAHYRRGALHFGTLSQTVKTQSYELVAWREFMDMRVGVTHKAQPRHQIALPVGGDVNLPTSETLGIYLDMPVEGTIDQIVRLAVMRETWSSRDIPLPVDWKQSRDNQLHLRYSLTF